MKEPSVKDKLNNVLTGFGMDTKAWSAIVSDFGDKLILLDRAANYKKLLRSLFSSKNLDEFNSYVFEVQFAYDFEVSDHPLLYETNRLGKGLSTVDFCHELGTDSDERIYFELRLIQQRNWITKLIAFEIKERKYYEIGLTGNDAKDETIRLQNLILSKCQDKKGNPIKFTRGNESANVIVVNVSALHLGMIDQYDCILTAYGDSAVPFYYRLGIFGLFQQLSSNHTGKDNEIYLKFKYVREAIHGILFVRHVKGSGYLDRLFIDRELEYFIVFNNNLLEETDSGRILEKLSFLRPWAEKEDN
jgi:hypothetical protein